jgi:hypothetical protein
MGTFNLRMDNGQTKNPDTLQGSLMIFNDGFYSDLLMKYAKNENWRFRHPLKIRI